MDTGIPLQRLSGQHLCPVPDLSGCFPCPGLAPRPEGPPETQELQRAATLRS